MAHGKDKQKQARSHYVLNRQSLPAVAALLKVPAATLRRWKAAAKEGGDDWDKARAAGLISGQGYTDLISGALEEFAVQFRTVMDALKEDKAMPAAEKVKLLASVSDAFNKTVAAAGRAAPKISELGVAYDVLQRLSDFALNKRPDIAPQILEILEPFGTEIAEVYDGR